MPLTQVNEILEQMPIGVAIAEAPSGKLVFHNRKAVELLRHPLLPSETSQDYEQYGAIHHDGTPYSPHEYPIARALKGEIVAHEEMPYRRGDGTHTWFLVNAAPIHDHGALIKVVSTFIDISERKQNEHALMASEQGLRLAFQGADLVLWECDISEGQITYQGNTVRVLGHSNMENLSTMSQWQASIHPDDQSRFRQNLEDYIQKRIPFFSVDYRLKADNDHWKWINTRGKEVQRNRNGHRTCLAGTHLDITELKQTEWALEKAQAKLQLAVDIAQLGVWEWNIATNAVYYSPGWKKQLGYEDGELPNTFEEWENRLHPLDRISVLSKAQEYATLPPARHEIQFRLRHRDGSYRWIDARIGSLSDHNGHTHKLIGTHLDITEHKIREEQVRRATQHDRLTGLPNRGLLFEFAEQAAASARRSKEGIAVLFIDLDRFKPINDSYGHHVGDSLLKEIASRLKACFRKEDIVGRLGGDEFLVFAMQIRTKEDAARVAQHAIEELNKPFNIAGLQLTIGASVGISLYPDDGIDIDLLVQNADAAMYAAKLGGEEAYRFYSGAVGAESKEIKNVASLLQQSYDDRSFQLYYQPIIDLETNRLVAVEALLRWPRRFGGPIEPENFLPIAEDSGLIYALGNWTFHEACAQHTQWQHEGLPALPIGLNLSRRQFRHTDLETDLMAAIDANAIDPRFLSIEVPQDIVMDNIEQTWPLLERLKGIGVNITLDDFGTSSINLDKLNRLPVDQLKIDRTFVQRLSNNDEASEAITQAIIAVGRAMHISVVAEGLDSETSLRFLRQHHCHRAQGFYLGKPMPGDRFTIWYRQRLDA